ncbi:MAG: DUF2652 domain-containing protein [Cytophagaceae bacterium]
MYINPISPFDNARPALIFIPDISGFTRFLRNNKISQSRKYVHELLEVIVDSNVLNMKVAEILGDAVLFYTLGTPPSITKIETQAKKTFLDFHHSLKKLQQENPELNGSEDLSLKIICHFGCISTTEVKGIIKLLGTDIILAHRLLKNNIKDKEYLLMTKQYMETQNEKLVNQSFKWGQLKSGKKKYDYIGNVDYNFITLSNLKNQ